MISQKEFSVPSVCLGCRTALQDAGNGLVCPRCGKSVPAPDGSPVFLSDDAAVCGGALHLFPDTCGVLRELARVMKAGAALAVSTFVEGSTPLSAASHRRGGVRLFEEESLRRLLADEGWTDYRSRLDGTLLLFTARRTG